jgi:hypothetical protein
MKSRRLIASPEAQDKASYSLTLALWKRPGEVRRKLMVGQPMSALGHSLADICSAKCHVRFTPNSGHVQRTSPCPLCANSGHCANSFNQLVGALLKRRRYAQPECLRGFKIDHQFVLGRRLHRKISGLFALKDTVDVIGRAAVLVDEIRPIGSPCRNAATRSFASGSSSAKFSNTPMRRARSVCCERATSGHEAAAPLW